MMLGRKCMVAMALATPIAVASAQGSAVHPGALRPGASYDPAAKAGAPTDNKSAVEKALHAVNPQDKDYGEVINSGRVALVEETFQNFLWWADVVLVTGFSLSLAGNYWQHRRTEDRLRISSAIVAQLYNSHTASRSKAFEAIEKHNRLADLYNAKCDETAKQQAAETVAEQKRSNKGENQAAAKVAEQQIQEVHNAPVARGKRENMADQNEPEAQENVEAVLSEADEIKRLKTQLVAKEQKISNLRSQVNRAHTSLEQERKRSPSPVQA